MDDYVGNCWCLCQQFIRLCLQKWMFVLRNVFYQQFIRLCLQKWMFVLRNVFYQQFIRLCLQKWMLVLRNVFYQQFIRLCLQKWMFALTAMDDTLTVLTVKTVFVCKLSYSDSLNWKLHIELHIDDCDSLSGVDSYGERCSPNVTTASSSSGFTSTNINW